MRRTLKLTVVFIVVFTFSCSNFSYASFYSKNTLRPQVGLKRNDDAIEELFRIGKEAKDIGELLEIANRLNALPEHMMTAQEKLNILSQILKITPANPTYFKGEKAVSIAKQTQAAAFDLKAYQDEHTEIGELKVGVFGVGSGDTFLFELLNAIAIGVKASYFCIDADKGELDAAEDKLSQVSEVKVLTEQNLLTLDPADPIWEGEGTFDFINIRAVLHEVYSSYAIVRQDDANLLDHGKGTEAVCAVIDKTSQLLRPGGKLFIMDGFAPEGPDELVIIEASAKIAPLVDKVIEGFVIPFHKGRDPQQYKIGDDSRVYSVTRKELKILTVIRFLVGILLSDREVDLSQELGNQIFPFMTRSELYNILKERGLSPIRFSTSTQPGDCQFFEKENNIRILDGNTFSPQFLHTIAVKGTSETSFQAIPVFDWGIFPDNYYQTSTSIDANA